MRAVGRPAAFRGASRICQLFSQASGDVPPGWARLLAPGDRSRWVDWPIGVNWLREARAGGRYTYVIGVDFPDVLAAAQAGEEWAFAVLYREYAPSVIGFLRARVGSEADDVAQSVWLEVARCIGRFEGDESAFRAWLFTIVRRRLINEFLRRAGPDRCCRPDDVDVRGGNRRHRGRRAGRPFGIRRGGVDRIGASTDGRRRSAAPCRG